MCSQVKAKLRRATSLDCCQARLQASLARCVVPQSRPALSAVVPQVGSDVSLYETVHQGVTGSMRNLSLQAHGRGCLLLVSSCAYIARNVELSANAQICGTTGPLAPSAGKKIVLAQKGETRSKCPGAGSAHDAHSGLEYAAQLASTLKSRVQEEQAGHLTCWTSALPPSKPMARASIVNEKHSVQLDGAHAGTPCIKLS